MKKTVQRLFTACAVVIAANAFAQTAGTLTFSFTQVAHSPCYSGSKNVLAVWIETGTGTFVKTRLRYCCNGSTQDHLSVWSVNAGGSANNCSSANTTGATTGATLTSFGAKSFTWDGKNSAGTMMADGAYKVAVEETWDHGTSATVTTYYTFTKGTSADVQTPATDANFSNISLHWQPTATGVAEEAGNPEINVYPNPSNGVFNIDMYQVNNIKVMNALGDVVYDEKIDASTITTKVDLSSFANGIYFITASNNKGTLNQKLILNK